MNTVHDGGEKARRQPARATELLPGLLRTDDLTTVLAWFR